MSREPTPEALAAAAPRMLAALRKVRLTLRLADATFGIDLSQTDDAKEIEALLTELGDEP